MTGEDLKEYTGQYSEAKFLEKIYRFAQAIGKELLLQALLLKMVLEKEDVPVNMKLAIIGALGYLICPVDVIPNFIPVAGFTDDAAAIAAAYKMIQMYITEEDKELAKKELDDIFNN